MDRQFCPKCNRAMLLHGDDGKCPELKVSPKYTGDIPDPRRKPK